MIDGSGTALTMPKAPGFCMRFACIIIGYSNPRGNVAPKIKVRANDMVRRTKLRWFHSTHEYVSNTISYVDSFFKSKFRNRYQFYAKYLAPFGECLTDIERKGMLVDRDQLASIETMAVNDSIKYKEKFLKWVKKYCADAERFNVHSASQKQQLLFAPCKNSKGEIVLEKEREFVVSTDVFSMSM